MDRIKYLLIIIACVGLIACNNKPTLFTALSSSATGIDFTNEITENDSFNVLTYEYMYNGGGVAVGDLNSDGLPDIYFTGNMVPNKLYLNKGNFKFDDITEKAAVQGREKWKTGATIADVNGDGKLDIYVCYSGPGSNEDRRNELYINNGNDAEGIPHFTEQAVAYGLDALGTFSTQAAFFDYDHDGDLDMFLVNHARMFYNPLFNTTKVRGKRHPQYGNRLYRNDNNHFTDVSDDAGILGNGLNFGLGIGISDLNGDNWPDIYVSNDYDDQDYCYINNRNGTFREVTQKMFGHLSKYSMGNDIADINNDSRPDIITLDMLPEDNKRQKLLRGADEYDRFTLLTDSGYAYQYMRNCLQLNRLNDTAGNPQFSDIGNLAGISSTDWSWSALSADYDNDGYKDLFITNGYLHDYTNLDFLKYTYPQEQQAARDRGEEMKTYEVVKKMPATKIHDYIFHNNGNLSFTDESNNWGFDKGNTTNGAAYADLNNDGTLDLIVSGLDEPSVIYSNGSASMIKNNFLKINLKGTGVNTKAIGAKVLVTSGGQTMLQENYPTRGFQSCVDASMVFGLGKNKTASIKVTWPDDKVTVINSIQADTTILIHEAKNVAAPEQQLAGPTPTLYKFEDITAQSGLLFTHHETGFIDFKIQFQLPYKLSTQGPRMAIADVNGDKVPDVFIPAAQGFASALFAGTGDGKFTQMKQPALDKDAAGEDVAGLFFDADGDGDNDLYVVTGGSQFTAKDSLLLDKLYINDGKGIFTKAPVGTLPYMFASGICATAADYDHDGDMDLFIGSRLQPFQFPLTPESFLLRNDTHKDAKGNNVIKFSVVTDAIAPQSKKAGMVTDALFTDYDGDGWPDLLVVGDWMPVKLFKNQKGIFKDISAEAGLSNTDGMWTRIHEMDLNGDGKPGYILGNMGTNIFFKASEQQPLTLYYKDFNGDGAIDPIICFYNQGKLYPYASRDELAEQMPVLNKKFLTYAAYSDAGFEDLFTPEQKQGMQELKVTKLQSAVLQNKGGKLVMSPLPTEAQFSPVYGMVSGKWRDSSKTDLLTAGNFYGWRVQLGRCDAGKGLLLSAGSNGTFNAVSPLSSGFCVTGDIRDMQMVNDNKGGKLVIVTRNNAAVQVLRMTTGNEK